MLGTGDPKEQAERAERERTGMVRLPQAYGEAAARRMEDALWEALGSRCQAVRDDPATWPAGKVTGFQALTRSGVFEAILTPELRRALNQLLGEGGWMEPRHFGTPLVTFPEASGEWTLPDRAWHLDFPARGPAGRPPGLRVLAFVSEVVPRGGGTLVLAGSHRLVEQLVSSGKAGRGHSSGVRGVLARAHPWLRDLWTGRAGTDRVRRYMAEGAFIDGTRLRVVELTGAAGDVVLMHPWTFHAPSANCGAAPRLMISESLFRAGHAPPPG